MEEEIGHWDHTLCRALVLLKQSPWLLGTILDGSPLQHGIYQQAGTHSADLGRITGIDLMLMEGSRTLSYNHVK